MPIWNSLFRADAISRAFGFSDWGRNALMFSMDDEERRNPYDDDLNDDFLSDEEVEKIMRPAREEYDRNQKKISSSDE